MENSSILQWKDEADGYRWYLVTNEGEHPLSTEASLAITQSGTYRYELFNQYTGQGGDIFECAASKEIQVVLSEAPFLKATNLKTNLGKLDIEVIVDGAGTYEYAIDNPSGPYQASNRFTGLAADSYRVFVRDKNGCGTADILVQPDLSVAGFPAFFSPNGDGLNDTWNYIELPSENSTLAEISIFDRYGNLVSVLAPGDPGWDGTYGGRPLPPSDYWFRALDRNGSVVQGHFTLKR